MIQEPTPARKRLSAEARRAQLLTVAQSVLEKEGPQTLTLAHLADVAGVSKPVAYDHFETREGLLTALLDEVDSRYEAVARAEIEQSARTLDAIADIVARAYVACALDAGPSVAVLKAAVEASAANQAARQSRDRHVSQFQEAFAPVLKAGPAETQLVFVALVAAANAVCDELTSGATDRARAEETLRALFVTSLKPFSH